ncbi:MAG: prepilin-type N-terminal cleavage/methylation domain-containing protein [Verrucomicrobia bacterium]|nr:prepilin-type N-terminal cleavage/methylation domain-containing protein [Verrucomicrobiota bacterium]
MPGKRRRGFTLIEILLALGLSAVVLTALSFHLFTLSSIWLNSTDDDHFGRHADGVANFLNNSIANSTGTTAGAQNARTLPVEWAHPPGVSDLRDPQLRFRVADRHPFFALEGGAFPEVTAYLQFERNDGLLLLWSSSFQIEVEDTRDLQRSLLSRFVTRVEYCYFDREDNRWHTDETPRRDDSNEFIVPDFLRLTFSRGEEELQRVVYLPPHSRSVPSF